MVSSEKCVPQLRIGIFDVPAANEALPEDRVLHGSFFKHLNSLEKVGQGYRLTPEARAYFQAFLAQEGVDMGELSTYTKLIEALRVVNAQQLARVVEAPSPSEGMSFVWNRLRKLMGVSNGTRH